MADGILTKFNNTSFVRQPELIEVWTEGYKLNNAQPMKAKFWGKVYAYDLQEAARKMAARDRNFKAYFNQPEMRWWGCRIFSNESDARRVFG